MVPLRKTFILIWHYSLHQVFESIGFLNDIRTLPSLGMRNPVLNLEIAIKWSMSLICSVERSLNFIYTVCTSENALFHVLGALNGWIKIG